MSPHQATTGPHTINPIAIIQTPFAEKFGIPRQSGLAPSARGIIKLLDAYNNPDTVRGLEQFSHIWVLFLFHQHLARDWSALVRPPRLGGNDKVGVFASRSTFRPNMIGQSVLKLHSVEVGSEGVAIHVSGADLLNGTPIIDIKPYLPYSDFITDANGGFAPEAPALLLDVHFTKSAKTRCKQLESHKRPALQALIIEVLQLDPRPAYRHGEHDDREYGIALFDVNVRFSIVDQRATVIGLELVR